MKLPQIKKLIAVCFVTLLTVYGFGQISDGAGNGGGGAPGNNTEVKDPNPPTGGPGGIASRATGGPDAYGYTWDDGVPFVNADITGTGTMIFSGDDVAGVVALGGSGAVYLYGQTYTSLAMASNGYISTDPTDTGPDLSNDCPLPATPSTGGGARIYPLHDDLLSDGYYQYFASCPRAADRGGDTGCHVFQWTNTTHFGGGGETWNQWVVIYENSVGANDMVIQKA